MFNLMTNKYLKATGKTDNHELLGIHKAVKVFNMILTMIFTKM